MAPACYEIRVSGTLPEDVIAELGDIRVTSTTVSTVLSGEVVDQAALLGVLARLRSLHLDVLEVRRVLTAGGPAPAGGAASSPASRPPGMTSEGGAGLDSDRSRQRGTTMTEDIARASVPRQVGQRADLEQSGPIDYLVVEFPGNRMTGEGFPLLLDLVDRGVIRILDLAFVRKDLDGTVSGLTLSDVDGDGELDLTVFEGASSGLLDDSDLDDVGGVLEPGCSAGVLVYENLWAAPLAAAWRRSGGQLVASGRIPVQAMLAALDAAEPIG